MSATLFATGLTQEATRVESSQDSGAQSADRLAALAPDNYRTRVDRGSGPTRVSNGQDMIADTVVARNPWSLASQSLAKAPEFVRAQGIPPALARTSLFAMQEWEGVVLEVQEHSFAARLCDLTNPDSPEELGEFQKAELSERDLAKVKPGAVFRWVIGYSIAASGNRKRTSSLVFRDLPRWTRNDIAESEQRASGLKSIFKSWRSVDQ